MTVVDRADAKAAAYRCYGSCLSTRQNRKGEHQDAWIKRSPSIPKTCAPVAVEYYTGVTDVNGQRTDVKHDSGISVETPIRIVMPDDEGGNVELPF